MADILSFDIYIFYFTSKLVKSKKYKSDIGWCWEVVVPATIYLSFNPIPELTFYLQNIFWCFSIGSLSFLKSQNISVLSRLLLTKVSPSLTSLTQIIWSSWQFIGKLKHGKEHLLLQTSHPWIVKSEKPANIWSP